MRGRPKLGKCPVKKCPGWIRWNTLTGEFEVPQDRRETLKTICEMGFEGIGMAAIARYLNSKKIPTFSTIKKETSRGKLWTPGSINLILRSPALKGDHQPVTTHVDENHRRKRSKAGQLKVWFFPTVMTSVDWNELQNTLNLRSKNHGKGNKQNITNLFGSLLTYGPDKSPIVITSNQDNQKIMSSRLMRLGNTKTITFPYDVFEFVFLKRMAKKAGLEHIIKRFPVYSLERLRIRRSALRLAISERVQSIQVWFAGNGCNRRCCVCQVVLNDSSTHLFSIRKRKGKNPETEPLDQDMIASNELIQEMDFEKWVELLNTKESLPELKPGEDFGDFKVSAVRKRRRSSEEVQEEEEQKYAAAWNVKRLTDEAYKELAEKLNPYLKAAFENPNGEFHVSDEMKAILRQAGAEFWRGELKNDVLTARVLVELTYQMCQIDEGDYWRDPEFYVDFYELKSEKKVRNALNVLGPPKLN